MMAGIPIAPDGPHHPVQGFWSAVRDVVRCNRKDGKRWQCAREVVSGQKYCERHVGRGRSRPKRSAENYSASSEVAATSSLGAISSISMSAAAGPGGPLHVGYNTIQASASPNDPRNHMIPSPATVMLPSCFEKVARVKVLYDRVRSNFPYFDAFMGKNHPVFMENAGGSQVPRVVIDAISNYMKASYVQLGAGYDLSNRAGETIKSAHNHMKTFTNAHGFGEVVFGPSTSQLLTNLSYCYSHLLGEGDEIIIHEANHEANSGPWLRMALRCGLTVKWWRVNYDTFESELEALAALVTARTRIVAVAHVSNILGEVLDLERVVKLVKTRVGDSLVRVVADGVAYAPHRAVDVAKWGVDWYVLSSYKVYGPHMAVLYGSHDAFIDVKNFCPNWDFIGDDDVTKQFELGGPNHEACAGVIALTQYLGVLARVGEAFTLSLEGAGVAGKEKQEIIACQNENAAGAGGGGVMKLEDTSIALAARVDRTTDAASSPCGPGGITDVSLKPFSADLQPPGSSEMYLESMTSSLRDWDLALQGTSFGQEALSFGGKVSTRLDRVVVEAAYDTIVLLEQPLQEKLLAFLRSRQDVIILGPVSSEPEFRVPTISFIHLSKRSTQICQELHSANFACRNGHMYCYRLISGLVAHKKLTVNNEEDGVVRISMVHYNTPIEVARLIACLQAIL